MSHEYFTILTDIGRRKLHEAIASGTQLHLTEMAVGDGAGSVITPNEEMTALVGEVYRAPITNKTQDEANPNWAVFNLIIPVETGGWYVREAGIYDVEGDLIFIGSLPENYKALPSQGIASDLAINMVVDIQRADSVTIVVDPATVLASQEWVGTVIETRMQAHNDDPDAHTALVNRLRESGDLLGGEGMENALRDVLANSGRDILVESGLVREALTAERVYYLEVDGDDANDGLSPETPMASVHAVLKKFHHIDSRGSSVIVQFGPGEFMEPCIDVYATARSSGNSVYFRGTLDESGNRLTTLRRASGNQALRLMTQARLGINDLRVVGGIWMQSAILSLTNVQLESDGSGGLLAATSGSVVRLFDIAIAGTMTRAIYCSEGSIIHQAKAYRTRLVESPVWTSEFAKVITGGQLHLGGDFVGMARGVRWRVGSGGKLTYPGSDPDAYFPGDQPGVAETGEHTDTTSRELTAHMADGDLHAGILNPELAAKAIKETLAQSGQELLLESGLVREKLNEPLTLYVEVDGDDANDGLTMASAKATIRGALDALAGFDCGKHGAHIRLGQGSFAGPGSVYGSLVMTSGSNIPLNIYGSSRKYTRITGSWNLYTVPNIRFFDICLAGQINAADSSAVHIYSLRFEGVGQPAINAYRGATVTFFQDCELEGDFGQAVFSATTQASIGGSRKLTVTGPVTAENFVNTEFGGNIYFRGEMENNDLVSARRWRTNAGGMLVHPGDDPDTYYPGDQPGLAETGKFTDTTSRQLAAHMADPAAHGGLINVYGSSLRMYVREDGNDANDGLSATAAKRTLQGAIKGLGLYTCGGSGTVIDVGSGSFETGGIGIFNTHLYAHPRLAIIGSGRESTRLVGPADGNCLRVYGTEVRLADLHIDGSILCTERAQVTLYQEVGISAIQPDATLLASIWNGLLILGGTVYVNGDCATFAGVNTGGLIDIHGDVIFVDNPAYKTVVSAKVGNVSWRKRPSGTVTGQRFSQSQPYAIYTMGEDPNTFIPGTIDG